MWLGCLAQPRPEFMVLLLFELTAKRLNDVARIGNEFDLTRFAQGFEPYRGCDDLRLIIGRLAEEFADYLVATAAVLVLVDQDCNRAGSRFLGAVAE